MTPCTLKKKKKKKNRIYLLDQILFFVVSNLLSFIFRKEVKVFNAGEQVFPYCKTIKSQLLNSRKTHKKLWCKCSSINLAMHRIVLLMNAGSTVCKKYLHAKTSFVELPIHTTFKVQSILLGT